MGHYSQKVGTPFTSMVAVLPAAICTRSTVVPPLAFTTAWKRRIFSSTRAMSGFCTCLCEACGQGNQAPTRRPLLVLCGSAPRIDSSHQGSQTLTAVGNSLTFRSFPGCASCRL